MKAPLPNNKTNFRGAKNQRVDHAGRRQAGMIFTKFVYCSVTERK